MSRAVRNATFALVAGAGLVLGSASAAVAQENASPDHRAPWPCGEERAYYHHANEVSNAIDFSIPGGAGLGTPALASAGGTIAAAGENGGYGNEVVIDHGDGTASQYAHLDSVGVGVGQEVAVGEQIGTVGSTGNSTGPHLHYEQREGDVRVPITIDGVAMNYDGATHHHTSGNC